MSTEDTFDVFAGMEQVWAAEAKRVFEDAPRCHFTRMEWHMGEDESWYECRHCGHTKAA